MALGSRPPPSMAPTCCHFSSGHPTCARRPRFRPPCRLLRPAHGGPLLAAMQLGLLGSGHHRLPAPPARLPTSANYFMCRRRYDSAMAASRETRSASFKPIAQPVYKPISSVLEKIRLRKLEILKKSNTPFEEDDDDASSEPVSDPAGNSGMPQAKEVDTDDKDLKIDDADNDVGANGSDLNEHNSVSGDEDALTREKDLNNCGSNVPDKIAPKRWRLEINFSQDVVLMLSSMNLPDGIQPLKGGLYLSLEFTKKLRKMTFTIFSGSMGRSRTCI